MEIQKRNISRRGRKHWGIAFRVVARVRFCGPHFVFERRMILERIAPCLYESTFFVNGLNAFRGPLTFHVFSGMGRFRVGWVQKRNPQVNPKSIKCGSAIKMRSPGSKTAMATDFTISKSLEPEVHKSCGKLDGGTATRPPSLPRCRSSFFLSSYRTKG